MKHYSIILEALLASCFLFACTQKEEEQIVIPVETVTISQPTLTLESGKTHHLTASVFPPNATDAEITWTSSNKLVAPVTENGSVTALYEGEAIIYATAGNKRDQCVVTVMASYSHVDVASITISESEYYIKKGVTTYLSALVVFADGATSTKVNWSSSNSDIASIESETGLLTAISKGDVTITAERNGKTATCTVHVVEDEGGGGNVAVTSVTLNQTSITLQHEQSYTLVATVKPDNATNKTVTWSSSEPWLVPVDQNGTVTGYTTWGPITATITAECGGKTATCKVSVVNSSVAVESITLDKNSLSMSIGSSYTLKATIKPDNATNKTVSWSSDNTSVATVNDEGRVYAASEGTATITAQAGEKTAKCVVTVTTVPVQSVSLNTYSITLKIGETQKLVATVKPDNATDKTIIWESLAPSVATVDNDGLVTAIDSGETSIIARAGSSTATCSVKVPEPDYFTAIDLGLSVKWANYNIGASSPKDYGDYYAWAELYPYYTEGHAKDSPCTSWRSGKSSGYHWFSYSWFVREGEDTGYLRGYNTTDKRTVIDSYSDVAHYLLGDSWRMPTKDEWKELISSCSWKWNDRDRGYTVTGPNGRSIFLPAAGYRVDDMLIIKDSSEYHTVSRYWSSNLDDTPMAHPEDYGLFAYSIHMCDEKKRWNIGMSTDWRYYGLTIRPVKEK